MTSVVTEVNTDTFTDTTLVRYHISHKKMLGSWFYSENRTRAIQLEFKSWSEAPQSGIKLFTN